MTNNAPLCVFSIQICFSCINSIFVIIVRLTNESNGFHINIHNYC